jgi:hypothetical protein
MIKRYLRIIRLPTGSRWVREGEKWRQKDYQNETAAYARCKLTNVLAVM